ncbi:MAG: hypothetical protein ACRDGT_11010 [Candidatus Limnocylindria bacterium]
MLARQALAVLEARMVNVSRFDPLTQRLNSNVWAWSSVTTYQRALATAQHVVPGFDPSRHPVPVKVNPAVEACVLRGERVVVPFEQIAAGTVNPWVIRLARALMALEWTVSVPVIVSGAVIGTFAAHFSHRPTDVQVQLAQTYADEFSLLLPGGSPPPGPKPA